MNPDEDPILDACLEEVLANRSPPNLAARIMGAVGAGSSPASRPQGPSAAESFNPAVPLVTVTPRGTRRTPSAAPSSRRNTWISGLAVAAAAALVGIGLTYSLSMMVRAPGVTVASKQPPTSPGVPSTVDLPGQQDAPRVASNRSIPEPESNPLVPIDLAPKIAPAAPVANSSPLAADTTNPRSSTPANSAEVKLPTVEAAPRVAASSEQIISFVNADRHSAWTAAGVTPSAAATDDEWCSRVFYRTLGRGPTAAELKQFRSEDAATRRSALVERILGDSYQNPFARHWSRQLATHLLGASTARAGSLANREELEKYLAGSLRRNKSLANITTELLTATGSSQPGPEYNPAVNFLLEGWEPTGLMATQRVARVFLGQRIDCAQCHQHPTSDWTQAQFWSLNAFFRQMRGEKTDEGSRLSNVDFVGEGRGSRDGEVFFETPEGLLKSALPQFLDGTEIPPGGRLAAVDRRRELAKLVVASDYLPRAIVNYVWAEYLDFGLVSSLDGLERSNFPGNAELLERLATEFSASGMELKSLIRWIVLSDPFQRSANLTDLATKDMPEAGEAALFSRYYSRPQTGAEVFTSLVQAQKIRRSGGTAAERDQARVDWLAQFNRANTKAGTKASSGKASAKASSAKSNAILSASSTIRATAGQHAGGIVPRLAAHSMKFEQKVEHLFLAAVGRQPTVREARAAATTLTVADNNHQLALEDIWWSLLNSDECTLNR